MAVRGLLARVARLEQGRSAASPIELWFGSVGAFTGELHEGVASGRYDARDVPVIIACVERWHRDGCWAR